VSATDAKHAQRPNDLERSHTFANCSMKRHLVGIWQRMSNGRATASVRQLNEQALYIILCS